MNHRLEKLQQQMKLEQIDTALFATSAAMQYLLDDTTYPWQRTIHTGGPTATPSDRPTGHFQNIPDAVLVVPAEGEAALILTEERAKTMQPKTVPLVTCFFYELGEAVAGVLKGDHIWVGESCGWFLKELILEAKPSAEITSGEAAVEKLRMIKEPKEVEALRAAAAFTDHAMAEIVPLIKPGVTQRELHHAIAQIARKNATDISFPPAAIFVESDAEGSEKLFSFPLDRPMKEGTSVGFDYGYLLNGYVSDYGRSFYCGKAPKELVLGYASLQKAQQTLVSSIRPGMRIGDCFKALYASMEADGYGRFLRRSPEDIAIMGHQIGIDTHERPWIHDLQDAVFEPGMVMCIEPKLWWPGKCYLRCEDMVAIHENGAEFLTTFDRELFELPV